VRKWGSPQSYLFLALPQSRELKLPRYCFRNRCARCRRVIRKSQSPNTGDLRRCILKPRQRHEMAPSPCMFGCSRGRYGANKFVRCIRLRTMPRSGEVATLDFHGARSRSRRKLQGSDRSSGANGDGGKYSYRIERQGNQASYSVSDGTNTVSMPIRWAMGASSAIGQTYILEKDGELYESRVSYYRDLQGLGPTLGSGASVPVDLKEAAGRLMSQEDKHDCFGCHATDATQGRQLTLENLKPGVQCKHCHEGVETHL